MFRSLLFLLMWVTCSASPLLLAETAKAQAALTRATVESLRNRARLIPQNQGARAARASDTMSPGDAIATAPGSRVDLRFNDRSLARLGEQAVFRFSPGLRSVDLSRGTLVLLVSPGQGRTNVRTPNSAAGIRGSALFVRYNPETDTTLVGALTNSQIEVFNKDGSDRVELRAGQMAALVKDRIDSVYNFDLQTFYQTSSLVDDLNLTQLDSSAASDEPINRVRAEVQEGLSTQPPISSNNILVNPELIQAAPLVAEGNSDIPEVTASTFSFERNATAPDAGQPNLAMVGNAADARSLWAGGEIQASIQRQTIADTISSSGATGIVSSSGQIQIVLPDGQIRTFPGRGATGGVFPGGGATGGVFPGGGATGGVFPGRGRP